MSCGRVLGAFTDGGGFTLATETVELHPNTADERARALRGIARGPGRVSATTYRAWAGSARADAERYWLAWTFNHAERVVGVEVAGIGCECATDLGGTFFTNTVTDVLRGFRAGRPDLRPVVTGSAMTSYLRRSIPVRAAHRGDGGRIARRLPYPGYPTT